MSLFTMQRATDFLFHRPSVFKALISAILQPSEAIDRTKDGEDDIYALDWEEQGFQASFSQLAASQSARTDPAAFAGNDVKGYLMRQVAAASERNPDVVSKLQSLFRSRQLTPFSAQVREAIYAADSNLANKLVPHMQAAGLALY